MHPVCVSCARGAVDGLNALWWCSVHTGTGLFGLAVSVWPIRSGRFGLAVSVWPFRSEPFRYCELL